MIRGLTLTLSLFVAFSTLAAPKKGEEAKMGAPKTGESAPQFTLPGADGKTYNLNSFKGKSVVVLEWFNNDCPYVEKHYGTQNMQKLQKDYTEKGGAVWFTIASSAPGKEGHLTAATANQIRNERGMKNTAILLDESGAVGRLYGANRTPHMFIIDKQGKIAYQGAIDDRPSADVKTLSGATNYVAAAMRAIEKGEPVKTASTTPYGCSIKYK